MKSLISAVKGKLGKDGKDAKDDKEEVPAPTPAPVAAAPAADTVKSPVVEVGDLEEGDERASRDRSKAMKRVLSPDSAEGGTGALMNYKLRPEDFELLAVVGKGSFGKVMQVRMRETGKIYAMKVLKKKALVARKQVAHTKTERSVLSKINHPFIVSLRFAFQTDTKLYMVLDYFNGGELFFHLKNDGKFIESRAAFYAAQIVLAIEHLHSLDIVYRDLKPENILLDAEGNVKLTDFGLSKESITGDSLTHTFCGTPEYLAPEVLQGEGYGKPVDWWSLGALLFEMLTGLPPFYNENVNVMYEKILYSKVKFPEYISKKAKALISALLERDVDKRLGSKAGASEVKSNPFFADIDWEKMIKKELEVPFKPVVTDGDLDLTNVDEEFKSELPKDTPVPDGGIPAPVIRFSHFTYTDDSALGDIAKASETGKDLSKIPE